MITNFFHHSIVIETPWGQQQESLPLGPNKSSCINYKPRYLTTSQDTPLGYAIKHMIFIYLKSNTIIPFIPDVLDNLKYPQWRELEECTLSTRIHLGNHIPISSHKTLFNTITNMWIAQTKIPQGRVVVFFNTAMRIGNKHFYICHVLQDFRISSGAILYFDILY